MKTEDLKQITTPSGNVLILDEFDQKILEQLAAAQKLRQETAADMDPD